MKLPPLPRPLVAALCGLSLTATAQERPREERPRENAPREERPAEGQRPPRGEFRPDERRREEARPAEGARREGDARPQGDFRRDAAPRGEGRPAEGQRGDFRPGEGQRGPGGAPFNQPLNPQELFRDLNDDQRTALRGFFEVTRSHQERVQRLRAEISELATAPKLNEDQLRDRIMEAARLEADATVARARAYAQVRERLPRETAERLRTLVAGGLRPTFAPMAQGGPRDGDVRREGEVRRPDAPREGDRRPAEGEFRRPTAPREAEGFRRPAEGDRGPRPDGDRGPRVDGDRGPRPDGDRSRNPEGGDRRPELPRRPPADQ